MVQLGRWNNYKLEELYNYESGEGEGEDISIDRSFLKYMCFKKVPVYSSSVQRCGQPTAVTVPVEQSYDRLQPSRKAV